MARSEGTLLPIKGGTWQHEWGSLGVQQDPDRYSSPACWVQGVRRLLRAAMHSRYSCPCGSNSRAACVHFGSFDLQAYEGFVGGILPCLGKQHSFGPSQVTGVASVTQA